MVAEGMTDSTEKQIGQVNCIFCGTKNRFQMNAKGKTRTYILRCQSCGREAPYSSREVVPIKAQRADDNSETDKS
jgi:transcription elongation factor Elf1